MPLVLPLVAIVIGLVALVWSSDKFVDGAVAIAERLGVSKLMVGLTIVALGTSAPEMLVSAFAAASGAPTLAIGNALGSNITNIGLVLGVTAMFVSLPINSLSMKQDIPVYLAVVLVTAFVLYDHYLGSVDGFILVAAFLVIFSLLIGFRAKIKDPKIVETIEKTVVGHEGIEVQTPETEHSIANALLWFGVGLAVLLLSSKLLVWGAVEVATLMGVSEVVIGLTIVAIGTSLPELAATLGSALKKHHDLAIGNIVGSNILNLVAVLPIPALMAPGAIEAEIFQRDFFMMFMLSLIMVLFIYMPFKKGLLTRAKGFVLLSSYLAYLGYLLSVSF